MKTVTMLPIDREISVSSDVNFQVRDEAMAPEYPLGCRIVAKYIDIQTAKFFQWGESFKG